MTQQPLRQASEIRARWLLILSACAGVACCSITLSFYTIGVLMRPVTETFGWSRAEFQSAMLLSSGLGALTAPVVGGISRSHAARRHVIGARAALWPVACAGAAGPPLSCSRSKH